jgi:hypothetical protein
MNKQFTPGKWKVGGPFADNSAFEITREFDGYEWVASVHQQFNGRENGEANARLIAAAPEMFELLERRLEHPYEDTEKWFKQVENLLTKITTP